MGKKLIDIDHLAELARLAISEEEKATVAPELESILEYVGKLSKLDTSGVPTAAYLTDAVNVWRDDEVVAGEESERQACLKAFPKSVGSALEVPGIFDERTE